MPDELKGMSFPPWLHLLIQLLATFFQVVLPTVPAISPAWMPTVHASVSFLQLAAGMLGHYAKPPEKKP